MSTHPTNPSASGPHLKLAALFGIAGALATLALMPYLLALVPTQLAALHWPQPALVLTQVGATGVLCWLLGWAGLRLGAPYGLDAPWLRAWVYRQPHDPARRSRWSLAALLGVLAALGVSGLSLLGPQPAHTETTRLIAAVVSRAARGTFDRASTDASAFGRPRSRAIPYSRREAAATAAIAVNAGPMPLTTANARCSHVPMAVRVIS